MRKRYVIAVVVLVVSAVLLVPVVAHDLHALLMRHPEMITISPGVAWAGILETEQVRKLYVLMVCGVAMGLVWILVQSSSLKYRSDMRWITPEISTPCAAGQGQYGTAKWMPQREYRNQFAAVNLAGLDVLPELVEAGRKDGADIDEEK